VSRAGILVLYYSRSGSVAELARYAARGVEAAGCEAIVRTVAPLARTGDSPAFAAPATDAGTGAPFVQADELRHCDGLVLGSPTRFGNMAAPLKHFLEQTSDIWLSGGLVDKPAGVFTSSSSAHGGQESTLLTMILPLVHHGMIWVGVPYTVSELFTTADGGGPYGASHVERQQGQGNRDQAQLSVDECRIAQALGTRVGDFAARLKRSSRGTDSA
jgi:NAD(P)H dehydrogenase (quinone)